MQSAPAAFRILQVDRAPRNREEQLDPVEGPRVLFDDGEVQHGPAEVVAAVDFGDDDCPVCETLCAVSAASSSTPSRGVGVGRLAQPGRRRSVAIVVAGAILSPSAAAAAAASCCCRSSSSTA